jgi:spore coat polysaccharide biosynthesis protein SpsF (cytidylyltransferase family)
VLLRFIGAAEKEGADIAVRVTGDNPLTDPGYIDRMIEQHAKDGAEYTYTDGLPEGTKAEVMSVSALKKCRGMSHNPEMSEYMTLYFRDSGKFKVSKITAEEDVRRPSYRLTIDAPQDLELLREIYRRLGHGGDFSLRDVVRLLDSDPSLAGMNSGVKPKNVRLEMEGGKMRIVERG